MRLPLGLLVDIDRLASEQGKTRTAVVIEALEALLAQEHEQRSEPAADRP